MDDESNEAQGHRSGACRTLDSSLLIHGFIPLGRVAIPGISWFTSSIRVREVPFQPLLLSLLRVLYCPLHQEWEERPGIEDSILMQGGQE